MPLGVRSAAITVVLVSLPLLARAGVMPAGPEFQINTYTTNDQFAPRVCRAVDGSFVAVWRSNAGNDGQGDGVFARRYASSGASQGTEFQVNTYTLSNQRHPDVCCDTAGNFVVVWESFGQDRDSLGVFGQRFASGGAFMGTEFQVNTYTVGDQDSPNLCCDASGNFVVAWTSADPSTTGVFGQRFASNGALAGTEFRVNTFTALAQSSPALCCDAAGDFVVAWQSYAQDGDQQGVFGQRFASSGAPSGTEFQINTYTVTSQADVAICCGAGGDVTAVWDSFFAQDGYFYGVFGQRFASSGAPDGTEFQVNQFTPQYQQHPSICCGPGGDFVVTWQSNYQADVSGSFSIFGRRFPGGAATLSEFQVNTYSTSYDQEDPAVACDATGDFVVVWTRGGPDPQEEDVIGRLFDVPTGTPTTTPTATPSSTPSNTPTATPSSTPSDTPTPTRAPNGAPCQDPTDCVSGNCVDDTCCVDPSCPPGQSCNVPGTAGMCAPAGSAPAPALSPRGLLLALASLLAVGGAAVFRRRRRT